MERVLSLKLAGACDREDSLGETLPILGLVCETELSPLDSRPDCPLRDIVCGLNALMGEEGEKVRPVIERSPGSGAQLCVRTVLVRNAVPLHPSPHQSRCIQQFLAVDDPITKSVPAAEDMPDFLEHVFRKDVGFRAAPAFLEVFQLSDQMSPAKAAWYPSCGSCYRPNGRRK